jgi:hypothetical protein
VSFEVEHHRHPRCLTVLKGIDRASNHSAHRAVSPSDDPVRRRTHIGHLGPSHRSRGGDRPVFARQPWFPHWPGHCLRGRRERRSPATQESCQPKNATKTR